VQLPRLCIAGAGAAGTALARALAQSGWPLGEVACRTAARAQERCALIGGGTPVTLEHLAAAGATSASTDEPVLVILGVPDRFIAETARALAGRRWPAGSTALHLSGSVEIASLAPLREAGLSIGGLHPLRSFVDPERDSRALGGIVAALEGDAAALALGERIAERLGMRAFRLAPGARPAWHAAASHACNHLVALLDQALDLMQGAGLPRDEARAVLLPLMSGTLDNLAQHAPADALTGPIVRGDLPAVERHLHALGSAAPDIRAAYVALARRALQLATSGRELDKRAAAALHDVLDRARDVTPHAGSHGAHQSPGAPGGAPGGHPDARRTDGPR